MSGGGSQPARSPGPLAATCVGSLSGHSERVWSVSWHPAGRLLASCSSDKSVRVWRRCAAAAAASSDACWDAAWECCAVLDGVHSRTVRCVSWSPCGRLLASAGFDGRVAVWSVRLHSAQRSSEPDHADEHAQAEAEAEAEAEAGQQQRQHNQSATDGGVAVDLVCQLEGHENEVKAVSWSADGRLLASCSRDKSVWVWERDEGADGSLGFECVSVCSGHSADVKHVAFHPTEPLLLSASYDDTVRLWREEEEGADGDWECCQTLEGHSSTVWMAEWLQAGIGSGSGSGGGNAVVAAASASDDRTVRVWSPSQPGASQSAYALTAAPFHCTQTIATPHTRSIFALHQHAHTGWLATCGADDSLCVYEPHTAAATDSAGAANGTAPSTPLSFRVSLHQKRAHQGDVNCVRFHPSPYPVVLASAGDDGAIKLWKIERQQQQRQQQHGEGQPEQNALAAPVAAATTGSSSTAPAHANGGSDSRTQEK